MPRADQLRARGRADFARAVGAADASAVAAGLVPGRGLTVSEVAKLLRVGEEKVRGWIRSGKLGAINTAEVACGRPRFIILAHHLAAFEKERSPAPPPKPPKPPRRRPDEVDFFPD